MNPTLATDPAPETLSGPTARAQLSSIASSAVPSGAGSGIDATQHPAAVYWGTVAAVFAAGATILPFLPGYFPPHTTSARVILLTIAAFLLAAAVTRSRPFRSEPLQQ